MGIIFDGRKWAQAKTERLRLKAYEFAQERGRRAKLAAIFDQDQEAPRVYTQVKAKKGEEIGAMCQTYPVGEFKGRLERLVEMLNADKSVDGIILQLPLEGAGELAELIDYRKDVDGMREDSPFKPAVVRAALEILREAKERLGPAGADWRRVAVLGSKGWVGSRLMNELHKLEIPELWGMDADSLDGEKLKEADVVIAATGAQGLFGPKMVKEGVCLIDVGYPKGDFDPAVASRAAFYTPVPGGVGPVTVACLWENVLGMV